MEISRRNIINSEASIDSRERREQCLQLRKTIYHLVLSPTNTSASSSYVQANIPIRGLTPRLPYNNLLLMEPNNLLT